MEIYRVTYYLQPHAYFVVVVGRDNALRMVEEATNEKKEFKVEKGLVRESGIVEWFMISKKSLEEERGSYKN